MISGVSASPARNLRARFQRLLQGHAVVQRPQAGGLDRRPVGHGIAEGHAQLDHIGAGRRQAFQDFQRGIEIRIAGGGEGDEAATAFLLQLGKALGDAAGIGGEGGYRGG